MKYIDLNCDMAESGEFDSDIMPFITSCNISCGFHAGSPLIISNTIRKAIEHGVKIGAHPSYNDSENFGRESMVVSGDQLLAELSYQISAVKGMVESFGAKLHHVKPHGALYNDIAKDKTLCLKVIRLIKQVVPQAKVYGLAESIVAQVCADEGVTFWNEAFVDRSYDEKTRLRSRHLEDAVLTNEKLVLKQLNMFTQGYLRTYAGEIVSLKVDTICLHSDTPGAVELSKKIFTHMKALGDA